MNTQEIKNIKLSTIRVNPNNPRKNINEQSLEELALSIKAVGVLQPIIVQNTGEPQSEYTYEIICGERRFRASQIAERETIPVIVHYRLTEQEFMEIALTENLLREDISPLEEMDIYIKLIDKCSYSVERLIERFGKSESYIRSRMRLENLIEEYHSLLNTDKISISVALELSKYSKEIQAEVFDNHFSENIMPHKSWLDKSSKAIIESLENNYTNDLEDYFFDKLECYNCSFNTQVISLFADENLCGRCTNRTCLKAKNTAYIVERAIETLERNPELPLARYDYRFDESAIEELTAKGYEIEVVSWCNECPEQPHQDDFESEQQYQEELAEYIEKSQSLVEQYQNGKIKMYALLSSRGVKLSYLTIHSSSAQSLESPLIKLQNQDKRNKEIAIEKIVADTKSLVKSLDVSQGEYSALEEQMTYFTMAKALRRENFEKVGIDPEKLTLSDCDRWHLVQNLTQEQKVIIKRDFIIGTFSDAARGNYTAVMLMEYAKQHAPDKYEQIQATHNDVYEKRHERILEKLTALENE